MPDTAPSAPPVDLAALIPAQRSEAVEADAVESPTAVESPEPVAPAPAAPERLAFLWAALGAVAGSLLVLGLFLALLTLLP